MIKKFTIKERVPSVVVAAKSISINSLTLSGDRKTILIQVNTHIKIMIIKFAHPKT